MGAQIRALAEQRLRSRLGGRRGLPVLSAYAPLLWNTVTWAVVAKINLAENAVYSDGVKSTKFGCTIDRVHGFRQHILQASMSMPHSKNLLPDTEMLQSLRQHGLLNDIENATFEKLTGGVSSDIWKVDVDGHVYCVKRALAKLKVQADWFAPVERNRYEVAWYQIANSIIPGAAPRILAHDDTAMLCAMEYLDPQHYKLWKTELHKGHVDIEQAAQVGLRLGRIHAQTANDDAVRASFPCADIFQAIRLEPYLEATAAQHAELKQVLLSLSRRTADISLTLIHGDVSPKNIMLGPNGPVFLDAECACIGDPAFDIAFCLNHLLLKCLWTPSAKGDFIDCFRALSSSYLQEVDWEPIETLEERAASLLPGLFLARVDGKSPVEYITDERDKEKVRRCARALLLNPPARLGEIADAWHEELTR